MTAKPRNCYQVDSPYYVFHRCKYKKNNYNNYYCRNFRTFAQNYESGVLRFASCLAMTFLAMTRKR